MSQEIQTSSVTTEAPSLYERAGGESWSLITGASSGIGYAYAREMARRGWNVLMVSNEAEAIVEKADIIKKDFPDVEVVPLMRDLSKQEAAKELFDWCQEQGVAVDMLINNAGVYHDKDFLDDSAGFTHLIFNLHMHTPAMMCYYFGQEMVLRHAQDKSHRGYIINMSSVTSNYGIQRMSTYSTTKGFLRLFSRSLYIELKDKGVNVCCVRPGAVATPLYNLDESAIKTGLAIGAIIKPETLARKGVDAVLKGKHEILPGFFTKILNLVSGLPTWLLIYVRRWGWF